ncbi:MAG: hypothetical protein LBE48_00935 [Methanomassiliicoccaceae archaeon]|nr:hypothetical protein [Methanomassiliicoccaceae archaeon]
MVKITIGKAISFNLGGKKKKEAPKPAAAPAPPAEKRCPVCGNNAPSTAEYCPRCQSRMS